jgi:hypothetical protein
MLTRRMKAIRLLLAGAITLAAAGEGTAVAQPILSLPRITDINFYVQGAPTLLGDEGLAGYGLEALFDVGMFTRDISIELGFGYGQLFGLSSELGEGVIGTIRAAPSISVYLTRPRRLRGTSLSPYLGLHSGWLTLIGQGVTEEGTPFSIRGDTYELGASLGLVHRSGIFLEAGYRIRSFALLEYGTPTGAPPPGMGRTVNYNGPMVTLGWQFDLTPTDAPQTPVEVKLQGRALLGSREPAERPRVLSIPLGPNPVAVKQGAFTLLSVTYAGEGSALLRTASDSQCTQDVDSLLILPAGVKLSLRYELESTRTLCAVAPDGREKSQLTLEYQEVLATPGHTQDAPNLVTPETGAQGVRGGGGPGVREAGAVGPP